MAEIKQIVGEEFRRLQLVQLEMLREFDRVCRKNQITYSMEGGTLLGAVRHKGYIPWDDDADIAMLREDYDRFKQVCNQLNPDICFFQDHSTDPEYRWGYGKLRRTGTTFVRVGQEHIKCKNGVFVDIFPLDDIPLTTVGMMCNDFYCFCLRKILYSEVGRLNPSIGPVERKVYAFLSHIPIDKVFRRLDKMAQKSKKNSKNRVRILTYTSAGKLYRKNPLSKRYGMPKEWFTDVAEYVFEDLKLWGTRDYDAALTYQYGDYMALPSLSDREPHSPVSEYEF